jgi:hypothetical protein
MSGRLPEPYRRINAQMQNQTLQEADRCGVVGFDDRARHKPPSPRACARTKPAALRTAGSCCGDLFTAPQFGGSMIAVPCGRGNLLCRSVLGSVAPRKTTCGLFRGGRRRISRTRLSASTTSSRRKRALQKNGPVANRNQLGMVARLAVAATKATVSRRCCSWHWDKSQWRPL